jgi:Na+/proline symporter
MYSFLSRLFQHCAVFYGYARVYRPGGSGFIPNNPGAVNLEIVTSSFPAWAVIPFIFMLVSGLLSTVDSNLCAIASLSSDITGSRNMPALKIAMLINLT